MWSDQSNIQKTTDLFTFTWEFSKSNSIFCPMNSFNLFQQLDVEKTLRIESPKIRGVELFECVWPFWTTKNNFFIEHLRWLLAAI